MYSAPTGTYRSKTTVPPWFRKSFPFCTGLYRERFPCRHTVPPVAERAYKRINFPAGCRIPSGKRTPTGIHAVHLPVMKKAGKRIPASSGFVKRLMLPYAEPSRRAGTARVPLPTAIGRPSPYPCRILPGAYPCMDLSLPCFFVYRNGHSSAKAGRKFLLNIKLL